MYIKFCYLIPLFRKWSGQPKRRWRLANKTPELSGVFNKFCSFHTKCICDLKSMGIVTMHEWKVPLKYWGMHLTLRGPLGYCRAVEQRVPDLWARNLTTYKRGGEISTISIDIRNNYTVFGHPHYSSPPPSSTPPPP
jgi:hypothetical protein